ncbi:hypothetical protein K2173_000651 [Erythroxylum novogranatense]|uniref:Uncharacterized protein n=1 Tax=Erythroxylum novogranatense TaxID=1862640 RepID=A0AAV8S7V7_9ROSI|nr:hypothetical protein K2173_000651 [Erythroxylum novogranatense]
MNGIKALRPDELNRSYQDYGKDDEEIFMEKLGGEEELQNTLKCRMWRVEIENLEIYFQAKDIENHKDIQLKYVAELKVQFWKHIGYGAGIPPTRENVNLIVVCKTKAPQRTEQPDF